MAGASRGGSPAGDGPSEREIDRLLHRLSRAQGWRIIAEEKADGAQGDGSAMLRLGGTGCGEIVVAARLLQAAGARDLVERCGGDGFRLSPAGEARLRRSLAGDDGFRGQHQHRGTRRETAADGSVELLAVDHGESPLAWLRSRKGTDGAPLIDRPRFEAGERLRADVTFGWIVPGLATQRWDAQAASAGRRPAASGIADLSDAAIAARERVERALAAVGPELAPVLVDVCCELKGLGDVEKARRWPPRSARVVLMMGLARLARHYGLMPAEG